MTAEWVTCDDCGASFSVDIKGDKHTRRWKVQNWQWFCDDCAQRRNEEITRFREEVCIREQDLPTLHGTDKQIQWALKIRARMLLDMYKSYNTSDDPRVVYALNKLRDESRAHWWIENRGVSYYALVARLMDEWVPPDVQREEDELRELEQLIKLESSLRPASPRSELIAEVYSISNEVRVSYPEPCDDFRVVVKQLRYRWHRPYWIRKIDWRSGPIDDRVVELSCKLLLSGFIVYLRDESLRNRVVTGEYEEECTKWITCITEGTYKGWFGVWWRWDEDWYREAKRLAGAKWCKPYVVVPPESVDEITDFAEIQGFRMTKEAKELVMLAKERKQRAIEVKLTGKMREGAHTRQRDQGTTLLTPESVEIPDDLKDDFA